MPRITRDVLSGLLLVSSAIACHSTTRTPVQHVTAHYLVTDSPIDVGVGPGLCVAVDVLDPHGVWWWEPGATGCPSRSTGPNVFHADQAHVSRETSASPVSVSFRLGTHSTTRPFIDVQMVVESGTMR